MKPNSYAYTISNTDLQSFVYNNGITEYGWIRSILKYRSIHLRSWALCMFMLHESARLRIRTASKHLSQSINI
ncbi:hypothetical protein K443DRAFT_198055 [Laccaria amethystina LaAM-08-1]|uniref:Uncharacterized protein n=1 Tax=Laccaria amethystina LaAM-08-1 TaxID=1095629 RepID=A0A0C9WN20_9AGAR|nr:hypothetical protein K443DRAFT_198055 [Laccaria amethystina LaAM-08-1]